MDVICDITSTRGQTRTVYRLLFYPVSLASDAVLSLPCTNDNPAQPRPDNSSEGRRFVALPAHVFYWASGEDPL